VWYTNATFRARADSVEIPITRAREHCQVRRISVDTRATRGARTPTHPTMRVQPIPRGLRAFLFGIACLATYGHEVGPMAHSAYKALLDEQASLSFEANSILDCAKRATRDLNATERSRIEEIARRRKSLSTELATEQANQDWQKYEAPAVPSGSEDTARQAAERRGEAVLAQPAVYRPIQHAPGATGRRYADLFGARLSSGGFRSSEEFLGALHSGLSDPRFQAASTTGIGSEGGFSVPSLLAAQWLDAGLESEIVRPRAQIVPMMSKTRKAVGFDASNSSTGPYGIAGGWTAEATEIALQQPLLRMIELCAHKLAALAEVSNELAADGVSYETQLENALTRTISWLLDYAFLNGSGSGQPLGALHSPVTIEVAKEVGQTAATVNYHNLVEMFARMHPSSVGNSVWVASTATIPQLATMTIAVGVGGNQIMTQGADGKFSILTRPVIFTEKVPTLGQRGDIGLYDFSQYMVGLRRDVSIDRSQEPGFTRDTRHYRAIVRADGQPTWAAAYTPKHGPTSSPFVILGART
jgi:HK97 family phage major capsid protein